MLQHFPSPLRHDRSFRHRAVAFGLAFTENTPLAPTYFEKQLLARYLRGTLTLDQVVACLEKSVPADCLHCGTGLRVGPPTLFL